MARGLPIGTSDFRKIRERGSYYVDKSMFVAEVLESDAEVLLLPRPRRFGKTLNLSTLQTFVERSDRNVAPLFEGLAIWHDDGARAHFQRYPVIHLTFKDVNTGSWADMFTAVQGVIAGELERHRGVLGGSMSPESAELYRRMLRREGTPAAYLDVLAHLSALLAAHHGERVIILIDEYDVPIQAAHSAGFFEEAVLFFRSFLSAGLKDNPHLSKAVLTGVLRVAKESIFSGLNNVTVRSVLSTQFATAFGFTPQEVAKLTSDLGVPTVAEDLQRWYDGYRFAGHTLYNPWSVMSYVARADQGFRPYWVFTGSDDVLRSLVLEKGHAMTREIEALIRGESVTHVVSEHVVLRELDTNADAVWSLLLMSGYLTARSTELRDGEMHAELAIPNREVAHVFRTAVSAWLQASLQGGRDAVHELACAMLEGEADLFEELLSELVLTSPSYHATARDTPERVYQAFVLGMLVHLQPGYAVRSE
ncbi:MAG: AAA family ATPase, partial [Polyangiaceae bacterium]|nr:AAA family ATPase [Polyangiaceae bacterium]